MLEEGKYYWLFLEYGQQMPGSQLRYGPVYVLFRKGAQEREIAFRESYARRRFHKLERETHAKGRQG